MCAFCCLAGVHERATVGAGRDQCVSKQHPGRGAGAVGGARSCRKNSGQADALVGISTAALIRVRAPRHQSLDLAAEHLPMTRALRGASRTLTVWTEHTTRLATTARPHHASLGPPEMPSCYLACLLPPSAWPDRSCPARSAISSRVCG
jgi:hypothetical protein